LQEDYGKSYSVVNLNERPMSIFQNKLLHDSDRIMYDNLVSEPKGSNSLSS